ncbi:outer membrane protein, partial [Aquamicrobium segne]
DDGDYLRPLESKVSGSIRGRVGYAIENVMPYFTAGVAIGSFRDDHNGNGSDIAKETLTGYAIGGGIEWGITQNLIARGEYIFSDYGTNDFQFSGNDIHRIDVQTHDFRIGLAYKF